MNQFEINNINVVLNKLNQEYSFSFLIEETQTIKGYLYDLDSDHQDSILYMGFTTSIDKLNWSPYCDLNQKNLDKFKSGYIKFKFRLDSNDSTITIKSFNLDVISSPTPKNQDIDRNVFTNGMIIKLDQGFDCFSNLDGLFDNYTIERQYSYMINKQSLIKCHYFRTEPDLDTVDVFLNEYSLFNTVDTKCIKIVVEDNEFPSERPTYNEWGYEWQEFEVYIDSLYFQEIFGTGIQPRNKDYVFFPQFKRMYYINSIVLETGIGGIPTFYTLSLKKYDREISVSTNPEIIDHIDEITTNREKLFKDMILQESEDISNPIQNVPLTADKDNIRLFINKKVKIEYCEIINNDNIIMTTYYDMTKLNNDDVAIQFNKSIIPKDITISMWYHPIKDDKYYNVVSGYSFSVLSSQRITPSQVLITIDKPFTHCKLLLLEYVTIGNELYKVIEIVDESNFIILSDSDVTVGATITFNKKSNSIIKIYEKNGIFVDYVGDTIYIRLNDNVITFVVGNLYDKWNGIIISISEQYQKIFLSVYNLYGGEERFVNKLDRIFNDSTDIEIDCLKFDESRIEYLNSNSWVGYMRIWKEFVNEDYHNTILTSIHVTNSSKTHVIDDCQPNFEIRSSGKDDLKYDKPSKFQ